LYKYTRIKLSGILPTDFLERGRTSGGPTSLQQRTLSRRKNLEEIGDKKIVSAIFQNLDYRVLHRGEWWSIKSVIDNEVGAYARALRSGIRYTPERFSWAHKKTRLKRYET
jgi:hypothetical protein